MTLLALAACLVVGVGPSASADVALPPADSDWDYQLGGPATPAPGVRVVTRDREERPAGRGYDVCYVNGFQTQEAEADDWRSATRRDLLLRDGRGRVVVDSAWGEWLLDTSTPAKRSRLVRIVGRWIDGCAAAGYDAVELDNLDSFTRSRHLLTSVDNLAYARALNARIHAAGMASAQKNTAELGRRGPGAGFDLAVVEECGTYGECTDYTDVYGDAVLVVEYDDRSFAAACRAVGDRVGVVRRDRDLTPRGIRRFC